MAISLGREASQYSACGWAIVSLLLTHHHQHSCGYEHKMDGWMDGQKSGWWWPVFPILRPLTVQLWLPRAPPSTLYKLLPLATTAVNSLHRYNEDLVFWFTERSNWIIFVNPWHSRESCLLIYQMPLGKNLVEITVWKNSERYDALGHFEVGVDYRCM